MEQLTEFFRQHRAERGSELTHTCICKPLPGSFYVPAERADELVELYAAALRSGAELCVTERRKLVGSLVVDIDLRFPVSAGMERRYTEAHVERIAAAYARAVFALLDLQRFSMYVMEKPGPAEGKECIKDGLHLVAPDVPARAAVHYAIRERVLPEVSAVLQEIQAVNDVEDAVDEAVIERNNWMMYGSRKPGHPPYEVTRVLRFERTEDGGLATEALSLPPGRLGDASAASQAEVAELVRRLSIRGHSVTAEPPLLPAGEARVAELEREEEQREERKRAAVAQQQLNMQSRKGCCGDADLEQVRRLVGLLSVKRVESYDAWMRVGWCLHNIDNRLLEDWIALSQRSPKFKPGECESKWGDMRPNGGLGIGTLHMWAKQDAPDAYREVVRSGLQELLLRALSKAHYDVARVVHHMFRYEYVCCSIRNRQWYEYRGHRWHPSDSGYGLRVRISTDVWHEFAAAAGVQQQLALAAQRDEAQQHHQEMVRKLNDLSLKLKTTAFKENVMKECAELFYVEKFEEKLDSRTNLIGFENGVYDLDTREFRDGRPDDYISFSTGCDYVPYAPHDPIVDAIRAFFSQVQPRKEMRDYLLSLFASFLGGETKDQKFHIWTGSGSNGKSACIDLFERSMGDYTCKFPVTLLTQKRAASNAATSELARAKGRRLAVLQEPSEDEKLHVGLMKELTGGDTIQCRALFKDPIEYRPQYKLVLLCNHLPSVPSDDGGTWRRIRVVEFTSKFCDKPQAENEFPIDLTLSQRFPSWRSHFLSLLLEEYWPLVARGSVQEPEDVLACTREYQSNNDHVSAFLDECVEKDADRFLIVTDAFNEFKSWVRDDNVPIRVPKKSEFRKALEKRMGRAVTVSGCIGIKGFKLRNRFGAQGANGVGDDID